MALNETLTVQVETDNAFAQDQRINSPGGTEAPKKVTFSPETQFKDERSDKKGAENARSPHMLGFRISSPMGMLGYLSQRMILPPVFGVRLWRAHPIDSPRLRTIHDEMLECVKLVAITLKISRQDRRTVLRQFAAAWVSDYRDVALLLLRHQFDPSCAGMLLIKPMVEQIMAHHRDPKAVGTLNLPEQLARRNAEGMSEQDRLQLLLKLVG